MPHQKQAQQIINARVLIVDDNPDLIRLMEMRLKPLKFQLRSARSAEEALTIAATWKPHLVITDLQMPGMSGMDLFEKLHMDDPLLPVIILTAHGTIPDAIKATQSGVTSFLTKPFDSKELLEEVSSALLNSGFASQSDNASHLVLDEEWRSDIVSRSPLMETLIHQIDRLSESDNLLLFSGEAGTGKSLLTMAAHKRSHRRDGPYIHISCKAMPEDKLELEIFGKIGTGNIHSPEQLGLLRQANQGTFVLHDFEVSSPAFLQKILFALIDQKVRPTDSELSTPIDVRAMTTTLSSGGYSINSPIAWELGEKLGLSSFKIPSLKKRTEDIPLIIQDTLEKTNSKKDLQFSNKAIQALMVASWPGNIRQLTNIIRQCARLTSNKVISESLVESRLNKSKFKIKTLNSAHLDFERQYLTDILKVTNGNVTKAASLAERNRTEFHRLLKKHKIDAALFRH